MQFDEARQECAAGPLTLFARLCALPGLNRPDEAISTGFAQKWPDGV
jgi:hypothetical protein